MDVKDKNKSSKKIIRVLFKGTLYEGPEDEINECIEAEKKIDEEVANMTEEERERYQAYLKGFSEAAEEFPELIDALKDIDLQEKKKREEGDKEKK